MEKMSEDLVWNVSAILHGDSAPAPFAMVVLNTPILTNPATVKSLWNAAVSRVTVDGGTNHWLEFLKANNAEDLPVPDYITGDFDSISEEARTYFTSKRVEFVTTPDQNETDFTKSLRELASMLSRKNVQLHHVLVLGTNCGRVDQIMANLETVHIAKNILGDVPVVLMSSNSLTWLLAGRRNHIIHVPREFVNKKHAVGLIPLRGATCVTTSGLKWDLDNTRLAFGELVSTSNTFDEDTEVTAAAAEFTHPHLNVKSFSVCIDPEGLTRFSQSSTEITWLRKLASLLLSRKSSVMKACIRSTTRWVHSSTKPFDEIPGPKSYPIVGTLINYLPVIGKYRFDALHHNGFKKFEEYGPVVREEIIPGTNVIWIFSPEDVQELLRKEGRYPQRRSHLALEHYRKLKPQTYNTGGLLPTNGKEWYKLRSAFQKGLSSPQTVRRYLPLVNQVIDDFLDFVASDSPNPQQDFLPFLSRVFLEMLALVAFDHRLNSFSDEEMKPDSRCSKLMESAMTINSCILGTDNGVQLWRRFNTPTYKKLSRAHHYLESVALDLIREKQRNMTECKGEESVLEKYLSGDDIDHKDILGMTADMLLAGIDTTTYSTGFILYHLANNSDRQDTLFEEIKTLLPERKGEITPEVLNKSHYLKAVVKESFRLNPISVGIGRILAEDAVFSNYHVPKECVVVTQNQVMCRFPKYFQDPDNFIPERWLKCNKEGVNPYLVLPFGHGPRTCIARRLAEQNIQALILKLCRRFEIGWKGDKYLDVKTHLINKPNGPLLFEFHQR